MTRIQNPTIQIPEERLLQLKELAAALGGATMSAVIGHLIGLAQKESLVRQHIPGVVLHRLPKGVTFQVEDNPPVTLTPEGARSLATTIRAYSTGDRRIVINMDHDFLVERRGNGVKVTLPLVEGTTRIFSVDLALDLAELIERAAATSV